MKKLLLLLALLLAAASPSLAYDFMVDGLCYNKNSDGESVTVTYERYWAGKCYSYYSGEVVIPESVAYEGSTYAVTAIGYRAFNDCIELSGIIIPNTIASIDAYAFDGCSSLTSFTIPSSVIFIGRGAFNGTPWLNNQPDGLVYAGLVAYHYKGEMPAGISIAIKGVQKESQVSVSLAGQNSQVLPFLTPSLQSANSRSKAAAGYRTLSSPTP